MPSNARTRRDEAIVLRHWKLGESDRIVSMLGRTSGKIRAVAKGVRRPGSRLGGRLESFSHVDLQLWNGRNLDTVQQAQLIAPHARIRGDFDCSTAAATIVELVDLFGLEGQQDLALFQLTLGALASLDAQPRHPERFADAFLGRLAQQQGFPLSLDVCVTCDTPGDHTRFSVAAGGIVCDTCTTPAREIGFDVVHALRLLVDGTWADVLRLENAPPKVPTDAARLIREHVERSTDRRIRTWQQSHTPATT